MDFTVLPSSAKCAFLQRFRRAFCTIIIRIIPLVASTWPATSAFGQTDWIKFQGNPVLDVGPPGSWDALDVCASSVLYDGMAYRMWYFGFDSTHARIGLATSPDGITWTKHADNPVLDLGSPGTWDHIWVAGSSVIFDGSTFKMWYSGCDEANCSLGYAESSDGIQWTKSAANPILESGDPGAWDDLSVAWPTVVFDGTTYHLWYHGFSAGKERIGYANSINGIDWTKSESNPVLELRGEDLWEDLNLAPRAILFDGATYRLWYRVYAGSTLRIDYASSLDGITWTKFSGSSVMEAGDPESWDAFFAAAPVLLFDGTTYKMWYIGHDGTRFRVGYATAYDSSVTWQTTITISAAAQLLNLAFGGRPDATESFDAGLDAPTDPPGADYSAFFSIQGEPYFLNTDMRNWAAPFDAEITWTLVIANAAGVTSDIAWNPNTLPPAGTFTLKGAGPDIDMHAQSSIQIIDDDTLTIEYRAEVLVAYDFPVADGGWYLISLPVIPDDRSVSSLFPDAVAAYGWDYQSQSYVEVTELEPRKAYWLLLLQSATAEILGQPVHSYTHDYEQPGWEMTGSVIGTSPLVDDPAGSVLAMFRWDPSEGRYLQVFPFEVEAMAGYWMAVFSVPSTVSVGNGGSASVAKVDNSAELRAFYEKYGALPPPPPIALADAKSQPLPKTYGLSQNYPNPFNPTTLIKFALPEAGRVKISVFNVLGEYLTDLVDAELPAGYHQTEVNAEKYASGIYFYVMKARGFKSVKKMVIIK